MAGAFLFLMILLLLCGLNIIGSLLYNIGQFIYIIIADVISASREKHKNENQIVQKTNEQPSMTSKQLLEEYYYKPLADKKKVDNGSNYSNTEEEFYCERCFKKISEDEYETCDGMCEECFDEVNFNNMF